MPPSLQSASCLIGARELHYVRAGAGPALMFLHGGLGSHRVWADLERNLADDHLMIAPDLFGHGASDKRAGDYSLGAHASTVRDLLDHLGLARVTLVGHWFGGDSGGIAMEFVYLFPERVDGLVLVASGGLGPDVNVLLRAPTLPGAEWVLSLVASRWANNQGKSLGRGLQFLGFRGSTDGDSRRAFLATIRSVVGPEGQRVSVLEFLPRLRCPTLLVWGDRDRMFPLPHARAAVELIPGARLRCSRRRATSRTWTTRSGSPPFYASPAWATGRTPTTPRSTPTSPEHPPPRPTRRTPPRIQERRLTSMDSIVGVRRAGSVRG